jgi:hypothetical protein
VDVRASDEDRERTLAALRDHTAAGRLSLDEFSERAATVYAARTLGELAGTTADLPAAKQLTDARNLAISFLVAIVVVAVLGSLYWLLT